MSYPHLFEPPKSAQIKAHKLLLEHLNDNQSYDWIEYRFFFVKAYWRFKRRWFVVTGFDHLLEVDSHGQICGSHGIHPENHWELPKADVALAQKLMLEIKPHLLKRACHWQSNNWVTISQRDVTRRFAVMTGRFAVM